MKTGPEIDAIGRLIIQAAEHSNGAAMAMVDAKRALENFDREAHESAMALVVSQHHCLVRTLNQLWRSYTHQEPPALH